MSNIAVELSQTVQSLKKTIETMNKKINDSKYDKIQSQSSYSHSQLDAITKDTNQEDFTKETKGKILPGQGRLNIHETFEQTIYLFTKFKAEIDRISESKAEMQKNIAKQKKDYLDFTLKGIA